MWNIPHTIDTKTAGFLPSPEVGNTHDFFVFHSEKPGGKGKRLPEVYCIVSRLGCFSLFSKVRTWASEEGKARQGPKDSANTLLPALS